MFKVKEVGPTQGELLEVAREMDRSASTNAPIDPYAVASFADMTIKFLEKNNVTRLVNDLKIQEIISEGYRRTTAEMIEVNGKLLAHLKGENDENTR